MTKEKNLLTNEEESVLLIHNLVVKPTSKMLFLLFFGIICFTIIFTVNYFLLYRIVNEPELGLFAGIITFISMLIISSQLPKSWI